MIIDTYHDQVTYSMDPSSIVSLARTAALAVKTKIEEENEDEIEMSDEEENVVEMDDTD